MKSKPRLRLVLLALGSGLLAAEGLLQLGYFVTWCFLASSPTPPLSGQGPLLLCIGDSFTYGVGASAPEHSYPAQLARELRQATGTAWRLDNRGWPGRCSRELLESIDAWLAESKPQLVCIAVGVNDTWQLPGELILPPVGTAALDRGGGPSRVPYVWTFRLWRLLTTFRASNPFRDQEPTAPSAPAPRTAEALVGNWQLLELGVPLQLAADGSGVLADLAIRWQATDTAVTLLVPPLQPLTCEWQRDGDAVVLRLPGTALAWRLRRQMAAAAPLAAASVRHDWAGEGHAAMRRGDSAQALVAFQAALRDPGTDPLAVPAIRAAMVQVHVALRHEDEAQEELQRLRDEFAVRRDVATAEALVQSLMLMRREAESLAVIEAALATDSRSPVLWAHLARLTFDRVRARDAIAKAIALAGELGWQDRSYLFREQARLHAAAGDGAAFVDAVVGAWHDDPDRDRTRQVLAYWPGDVDAVLGPLHAACLRRGLDSEAAGAMVLLLRQAKAGHVPEGWQRTYRSHVVQLLERCRAAGAEPVLVGYPFRFVAQDLQQQLAEQQRCLFVPLDAVFRAVKESEPQRRLFAADGHCNDDGYGIMAKEVARALTAKWATTLPPGPNVQPATTK